jgi:hypothetical protein
VPRRSSRRYRRRHPPQRTSTREQLELHSAGRRPRLARWSVVGAVVIVALGLFDTRTGLVRAGRPPQAALLVDALLLGGGVLVYVIMLRTRSRARDRAGRSSRRR